MNALYRLWRLLIGKAKRTYDGPAPVDLPGWEWAEPTGDFYAELEAARRELASRRGTTEDSPRERHRRDFARHLNTLEKILDSLACRAALIALRDSGLTGGYLDGPLPLRQNYIAGPGGAPLYGPRAALALRKPAYVMDQPPHTYFKAWYAGVWAYREPDSGAIALVVGRAEEPTSDGAGERLNLPVGQYAAGDLLYYDSGDLAYVRAEVERRLLAWAKAESLG